MIQTGQLAHVGSLVGVDVAAVQRHLTTINADSTALWRRSHLEMSGKGLPSARWMILTRQLAHGAGGCVGVDLAAVECDHSVASLNVDSTALSRRAHSEMSGKSLPSARWNWATGVQQRRHSHMSAHARVETKQKLSWKGLPSARWNEMRAFNRQSTHIALRKRESRREMSGKGLPSARWMTHKAGGADWYTGWSRCYRW